MAGIQIPSGSALLKIWGCAQGCFLFSKVVFCLSAKPFEKATEEKREAKLWSLRVRHRTPSVLGTSQCACFLLKGGHMPLCRSHTFHLAGICILCGHFLETPNLFLTNTFVFWCIYLLGLLNISTELMKGYDIPKPLSINQTTTYQW